MWECPVQKNEVGILTFSLLSSTKVLGMYTIRSTWDGLFCFIPDLLRFLKNSEIIANEKYWVDFICIVVVQSLNHVWHFATPWTAVHQASLSLTISLSLLSHVHWVDDAIQQSRPLSPPSPLVPSLSQHQGLFQWVSFSHQVAKVLEFRLWPQSFQWIFRTGFL